MMLFFYGAALGVGAGFVGGGIVTWLVLRLAIWHWRSLHLRYRREARDWRETCGAWRTAAQARRKIVG
jgi:hypothetical protein